jgi:hypothetical protein
MTIEHLDTIRRREDGCIDTAYYLQRGRFARSQMAYSLPGKIAWLARCLFNWLKLTSEDARSTAVSLSGWSETKPKSGDTSDMGIALKEAA